MVLKLWELTYTIANSPDVQVRQVAAHADVLIDGLATLLAPTLKCAPADLTIVSAVELDADVIIASPAPNRRPRSLDTDAPQTDWPTDIPALRRFVRLLVDRRYRARVRGDAALEARMDRRLVLARKRLREASLNKK